METSLLAQHNALWDCFLAVIPVSIAYAMLWVAGFRRRKMLRNSVIGLMGLAWLAFLPNTCYLLTEWRHFMFVVDLNNLFIRASGDKTLFLLLCKWWVFFFLFSGFGMMMFALAIRPIERLAAGKGATTWFWALPLFTALSLGVYLGLILRFNSWDLLQQPGVVWAAIVDLGGRPKLASFIFGFGVVLWLIYEALDIWVDGLADRFSRLTGWRFHLGPKQT